MVLPLISWRLEKKAVKDWANKHQPPRIKQQPTTNKQQAASNKRRATRNTQQPANRTHTRSKTQQTPSNKQQTTTNQLRKQAIDNKQQPTSNSLSPCEREICPTLQANGPATAAPWMSSAPFKGGVLLSRFPLEPSCGHILHQMAGVFFLVRYSQS